MRHSVDPWGQVDEEVAAVVATVCMYAWYHVSWRFTDWREMTIDDDEGAREESSRARDRRANSPTYR